MQATQQFFENLYDAFNRREIETILSTMTDDVQWANGMEGGFVDGRENVREYWQRQFELISPQLEILRVETDAKDRAVVTVQLVVRDLSGKLLDEKIVRQIFTFEDGLIKLFELEDVE